ncbi:hypothetical protein MALG_03259 [Marinovum algicola DG 898]|nr:hypothetical protein MALG_03259 [Marinovum algicola DG 898]
MAGQRRGFLDRITHRGALRRWRNAALAAPQADLAELRRQRGRARKLRRQLDELLHVADYRLALPAIGSDAIAAPHDSDWTWRPEAWRGPLPAAGGAAVESGVQLGGELTLFHDCTISELTLRQLRNTREADLAPFGLRMDVFRFDGSYLSLAVALPSAAVAGLTKAHLMRVDCMVELESPLEIFARLNVKSGPNTEKLVREVPLNSGERYVEFDLAYSRLNEKRIDKAWLDLIFEGPQMNQVVLRDLTFSRRLRAEI